MVTIPPSSHKRVIAAVKKLVSSLGGKAWVTHQGPGTGQRRRGLWGDAGIPDMICMVPRRAVPHCTLWDTGWPRVLFFVEVKVGRDRQRDAQRRFLGLSYECGISTVVGGLDAVLEALGLEAKKHGRSTGD